MTLSGANTVGGCSGSAACPAITLSPAPLPAGTLGVSALTGQGFDLLERAIRLRARPEPDRFYLEIPYTNSRGIAAARAHFRIVEEVDLGDALRLEVAGERKNLGALSRRDLGRLREVTASQGLMLESVNPGLVAHQGSPTKHPEQRLATICAAGVMTGFNQGGSSAANPVIPEVLPAIAPTQTAARDAAVVQSLDHDPTARALASGTAGTVIITSLTATRIAGTFSFNAADVLNPASTRSVTNGAFDLGITGTPG